MGWLWSSSAAPAAASSQDGKTHISSNNNQEPSTTSQPVAPSQPLSRDELAEKELQAFLEEIGAGTHPSSTRYNRVPKQPPPPTASTPDTPSHKPVSEQILPETMSCRDAFDSAFYCNSMGGQFNNLYRYGKMRECNENWNDFWFCMRVRTWGGPQKAEAIKARYREKEKQKYGRERVGDGEYVGRSSEDVWKSRDKKVEWGTEFQQPPPAAFQGSDAEWNEQERQRRKDVAKTLGSY